MARHAECRIGRGNWLGLIANGGLVRVRWWQANGLHVHVSYPDGMWERRTWKGNPYWEVDALVMDLEERFGKANVQLTP